MSALRVSPAVLRAAVVANAVASPIPAHHRVVYAILARANSADHPANLAEGEQWLLDSFLRLPALSEHQQARLTDIALRVERGRE